MNGGGGSAVRAVSTKVKNGMQSGPLGRIEKTSDGTKNPMFGVINQDITVES